VKLRNKSMAATIAMMTEPLVASDTEIDPTVLTSQASDPKKTIIKNNKKVLLKNKDIRNNKTIIMLIGSLILILIIGILGEYLSKESSADTGAVITKTTVPEVSVELPSDENKLVPSLIGNTQDIATNTIVNNGFLLGDISNEYSDNIAKGLIISQSPVANTSYEKNGKIDLVISQGKKIIEVAPSQSNVNKGSTQSNGKKKEQKGGKH
jgi:serine/threonine-protein kinase